MTQHLLIGMLAPTFLVMAAPVKLLLRSLPQHTGRLCAQLFHHSVFRIWSHPATAFILNFGGMFVLYLSPLYRASQDSFALHLMIHLHFLVAGFLFAWSLVGPDPHPGRPAFAVRLGILFLAITCHGLFSKYMYIYGFPYGTSHSLEDIRAGAQLMFYGGDLAEVILAILLFSERSRRGRTHTKSSSALASVG